MSVQRQSCGAGGPHTGAPAQLRGADATDVRARAPRRAPEAVQRNGVPLRPCPPDLRVAAVRPRSTARATQPKSVHAREPAARAAAQRSAAFAAGRARPRVQTSRPDWPRGASSRACARGQAKRTVASPASDAGPQRSRASCDRQRRVPRRVGVTPRRGAAARRQRGRHCCNLTRALPFTPPAPSPCAHAGPQVAARAQRAAGPAAWSGARGCAHAGALTRHARR